MWTDSPTTSAVNIRHCDKIRLLALLLWLTGCLCCEAQWSDVPMVRRKTGVQWWKMLWEGGMVRPDTGCWYMMMPDGLSDLAVMNYVDGYSVGPHARVGYISPQRQRWELEETVRYACSRHVWMVKGALRWYSPIEQGVMVELYGGQHSEDFDHNPTMDMSQSLLATGLCGWNHYKLLERTDAGLRMTLPLSGSLTLHGYAGWERRRTLENHRRTNSFGAHPQSNIPRIRDGKAASTLRLYDGPVDGALALAGLQLDWQPQQQVYVYDDMTSWTQSACPTVTLCADAGMGDWHYLSLEARVRQDIATGRYDDKVSYQVSGGGIIKDGTIGLADWHHADASTFWWQRMGQLTRFAMLDNYELSTDRSWIEAHAEWLSGRMLLSQLTRSSDLMQEYVQAHVIKVPSHRVHCELQYGIVLVRTWRLGVAAGMDGTKWHSLRFTMALDISSPRKGLTTKRVSL